MDEIEKIIYQRNDETLIISIGKECTVKYNDNISKMVNEHIMNYVNHLFGITFDWEKEYIDLSIIDGDIWNLTIQFIDGKKTEYSGKGCFPYNFKEFERLNLELIKKM